MSAVENEVGANGTQAPKAKKPEYLTVKMDDGTEDTFPINARTGKTRMLNKYYDLNDDGSLKAARFNFNNGKVFKTVPPASLIGQFAGHGVIQKYGDELAGLKNSDGTPSDDPDDAYLTLEELDENIQKGQWSTRREGDGLGGTSILIKALLEYGGKPLETVKAFLKDKDKKFKDSLRANDQRPNKAGLTMAAIVKRLEAEKASKGPKVDTTGALDDLDAMGA